MVKQHVVKKTRSSNKRGKGAPYLFLAPFLIVFSVFMIFPILYALVISFSRWQGGSLTWAGLYQYSSILSDSFFWQSLGNILLILVIQVPIMLLLSVMFASMLNSSRLRFRSFFQLGFFLPILIDTTAYSLTFSFIFAQHGLLNQTLSLLGIGAIPWLTSMFWSKIAVMIAMTWHWTGYNVVILLGGLQSVPPEIYEAARVDGAGPIRQWFSMTIPMLRPLLVLEFILSTIGTLQLFTEPYILTAGGPDNSSLTPVLYLYQVGFQQFHFGYASALAYVLALIIAIFSFFQLRFTRGGSVA
nr:sugar ABC transporter permease [Bacilli bacterium]